MSDDFEIEGSKIGIAAGNTRVTSFISTSHLQAADFFLQQSKDIEDAHDNDSIPQTGQMSKAAYRSYCTSAITSVVAFLDSTINELYVNMSGPGGEQHYPQINDSRFWGLIDSDVGETASRDSVLGKYNNMLLLAGKNEISLGEDPGQAARYVCWLRNKYLHYEPKNVEIVGKTETGGEYGFEESLRNRFDLSPFTGDGNPFFPDQCQSCGCAEWSIKRSLAFTEEFFDRIGIDRPYDDMLEHIEIDPP